MSPDDLTAATYNQALPSTPEFRSATCRVAWWANAP